MPESKHHNARGPWGLKPGMAFTAENYMPLSKQMVYWTPAERECLALRHRVTMPLELSSMS